jgi:hypothetical protein
MGAVPQLPCLKLNSTLCVPPPLQAGDLVLAQKYFSESAVPPTSTWQVGCPMMSGYAPCLFLNWLSVLMDDRANLKLYPGEALGSQASGSPGSRMEVANITCWGHPTVSGKNMS